MHINIFFIINMFSLFSYAVQWLGHTEPFILLHGLTHTAFKRAIYTEGFYKELQDFHQEF